MIISFNMPFFLTNITKFLVHINYICLQMNVKIIIALLKQSSFPLLANEVAFLSFLSKNKNSIYLLWL